MISEIDKRRAQDLYDKVHNIKKVAKELHILYSTLKRFIVFSNSDRVKSKAPRDTSMYRRGIKAQAVKYKGGRCEICGYDKCMDALDFHHLSPKEKDFNISGGTKSFESIKSELDKCILVCANCHREIHAGIHPIFTSSGPTRELWGYNGFDSKGGVRNHVGSHA